MVYNEELDQEIPEGWSNASIKDFGKILWYLIFQWAPYFNCIQFHSENLYLWRIAEVYHAYHCPLNFCTCQITIVIYLTAIYTCTTTQYTHIVVWNFVNIVLLIYASFNGICKLKGYRLIGSMSNHFETFMTTYLQCSF